MLQLLQQAGKAEMNTEQHSLSVLLRVSVVSECIHAYGQLIYQMRHLINLI